MFLHLDKSTPWVRVKDGNDIARKIFDKHYSRKNNAKQFIGPGQKLVLVSHCGNALFAWRKYISDNEQTGVNCAIFRNESNMLSSYLILEAEKFAFDRWGKERLFTYVNANKIRSSNPGYCFKQAGWKTCGTTKINKLIILEKQ